jgi:transcriptional regulator with XRE-family HTH domain
MPNSIVPASANASHQFAVQVRAARLICGWTRPTAARKAGISLTTVQNIEAARRGSHRRSLALLIAAYRRVGVDLLPDGSLVLWTRNQERVKASPDVRPGAGSRELNSRPPSIAQSAIN